MNIDELEKWRKAGKLAHDALHFGKKMIEEDKSMLDITEKIENYVYNNGGKLAFPTNLAINNVGAHWTPSTKTTEKFQKGDIVKYVGRNAAASPATGNLNKHLAEQKEILEKVVGKLN